MRSLTVKPAGGAKIPSPLKALDTTAKRLPEIGGGLGKGIKNFKNSLSDAEKEIKAANLEAPDKVSSESVEHKS